MAGAQELLRPFDSSQTRPDAPYVARWLVMCSGPTDLSQRLNWRDSTTMSEHGNAVHRLALVGAGQVGSRHLQGLARLQLPCEIDVVDSSSESLKTALARFEEVGANPMIRAIRFHTSMDALPRELDYVIVATSADVRLGVVQRLLERASVRRLLLEKVLFQNIGDYELARALLAEHAVMCWVNCTRRAYPIYSDIREFFAADPIRHFQVRGGGWGLGCNSVHFLDLLGMLTDDVPEQLSARDLDPTLIPSKRKDFFEFTGTLRGRYRRGTEVEITSLANSSARRLQTFRSERRVCMVDETAGCAFFLATDSTALWERKDFRMPLTSELATPLAAQILTHDACALPTFEQSVAYHLPLVDTLGRHAAAFLGTSPEFCPIT